LTFGFSFFLLQLFSYILLLLLVPVGKESYTVKGFLDWYYWLVHLLGGTTPTYPVLRTYYPVLETELRHIPSLLRVWFGFSFCRCFSRSKYQAGAFLRFPILQWQANGYSGKASLTTRLPEGMSGFLSSLWSSSLAFIWRIDPRNNAMAYSLVRRRRIMDILLRHKFSIKESRVKVRTLRMTLAEYPAKRCYSLSPTMRKGAYQWNEPTVGMDQRTYSLLSELLAPCSGTSKKKLKPITREDALIL